MRSTLIAVHPKMTRVLLMDRKFPRNVFQCSIVPAGWLDYFQLVAICFAQCMVSYWIIICFRSRTGLSWSVIFSAFPTIFQVPYIHIHAYIYIYVYTRYTHTVHICTYSFLVNWNMKWNILFYLEPDIPKVWVWECVPNRVDLSTLCP